MPRVSSRSSSRLAEDRASDYGSEEINDVSEILYLLIQLKEQKKVPIYFDSIVDLFESSIEGSPSVPDSGSLHAVGPLSIGD